MKTVYHYFNFDQYVKEYVMNETNQLRRRWHHGLSPKQVKEKERTDFLKKLSRRRF